MKQLLFLLLLPAFACAQEVNPIISKDYLSLIEGDTLRVRNFWPDTTNSIKLSPLLVHRNYYGLTVRKIIVRSGQLDIQPYHSRVIMVGGQFNSRVEIKQINRIPELQSQYVQGRSQNGALVWRGPETGELFSYGPEAGTLEYDGSNYAWDENGKLAPAGSGNGKPANTYNNSIFRTASLLSQSLRLQGRYLVGGKQVLNATVKLGQSTENTFIQNNRNTSRNLSASVETLIKTLTITGGYTYLHDEFSNPNRNGFLNRAYQDALLTPISFNNAYNAPFANRQTGYSPQADNPVYLLTDNGNRFLQTHRTGSIMLERKLKPFRYKIAQTIERLNQLNKEGYKPGAAYFPNGIGVNREKNDVNYVGEGFASYEIPFGDYELTGTATAHYSFTANRSAINYSTPTAYRYQRSAHDASLSYVAGYRANHTESGLTLANKIYASNTTTTPDYFLPNISGFFKVDNFLVPENFYAKVSVAYNRFNSELPIGRSFSQNSLLQYSTQQAFQYFPVTEVTGFNDLDPVRHKEWTSRLEISYKYRITLYGEVFNRKAENDVFPVLENGNLVLKNLAGHRSKGFELGLSVNHNARNFYTENNLSFFTNSSKVTEVKDGYDHTPVAGFSNVHTAIVKGASLGSIVGTSYQRDAGNNILIGNDGFPLVNTTPKVIGNPIPDFVLKMSNNINWKNWTLDLNWEWKKGGQMWNGTQAVLDYYGRSASTAALRGTTGYVFAGVLSDKQPNTIPVTFYDANAPVENNRWTRYGHSGIGEEYIQRADVLRLNSINLSYKQKIRKYLQQITISLFANNLILYTAYKGADPSQLLYDQPNTTGLDFFNLPSLKSYGCNISIQF